jgi:hypothetical protein
LKVSVTIGPSRATRTSEAAAVLSTAGIFPEIGSAMVPQKNPAPGETPRPG